jgi:hypothetical protein
VQTKALRLGMYLLGQAFFSRELIKDRFAPRSVRTIALCAIDDAILRPIAERFGVEVVVDDLAAKPPDELDGDRATIRPASNPALRSVCYIIPGRSVLSGRECDKRQTDGRPAIDGLADMSLREKLTSLARKLLSESWIAMGMPSLRLKP